MTTRQTPARQLLPLARRAHTEALGISHDAIEIALDEATLRSAGLVEIALSVRPRKLGGHLSGVLQHFAIGRGNALIGSPPPCTKWLFISGSTRCKVARSGARTLR